MTHEPTWFAVRHVLKNDSTYEERVTLWDAQSFEAAHELARTEAEEHMATVLHDGVLLDLFQIYMLSDHPADGEDYPPAPGAPVLWAPQGAEVFSLIRESELGPAEYLDLFFDTGYELEGYHVQIFGAVRP